MDRGLTLTKSQSQGFALSLISPVLRSVRVFRTYDLEFRTTPDIFRSAFTRYELLKTVTIYFAERDHHIFTLIIEFINPGSHVYHFTFCLP